MLLSLSPSSVTTIFGKCFLSILPYQPTVLTDFHDFMIFWISSHDSPKPTKFPIGVYNGLKLPLPLPVLLSFNELRLQNFFSTSTLNASHIVLLNKSGEHNHDSIMKTDIGHWSRLCRWQAG